MKNSVELCGDVKGLRRLRHGCVIAWVGVGAGSCPVFLPSRIAQKVRLGKTVRVIGSLVSRRVGAHLVLEIAAERVSIEQDRVFPEPLQPRSYSTPDSGVAEDVAR